MSECKECGSTDHYNFELNIGLCNPCIGKRLEHLQAENERLKGLLKAASCPNCNGDGAYYDSYGDVCQCQWCYERDQAIKETQQ